ncbi:MAG: hypothetical protein ABIH42_03650 [Planctomycetota bacterium]
MFNMFKLALKNIRENKVRAVLTMIGASTAVFIFCFFQSIQTSMGQIVREAGKQNNLVIMEKNKW